MLTKIGAATSDEQKGFLSIPVATAWFKGQTIKGGIVPIRDYQVKLKQLIESDRVKPSLVFDKEILIEDAPKAYKEFSDHDFIKTWIRIEHVEVSHKGEEKTETPPKKRRRNAA